MTEKVFCHTCHEVGEKMGENLCYNCWVQQRLESETDRNKQLLSLLKRCDEELGQYRWLLQSNHPSLKIIERLRSEIAAIQKESEK